MFDDVLFVGFALLLTKAQILIPNSSVWLVHQEGFVEVRFLAHGPCGKFVLVFFAYCLHGLLSISFSSCVVNTDVNNLGEQCRVFCFLTFFTFYVNYFLKGLLLFLSSYSLPC
jgi:hypothetical protein